MEFKIASQKVWKIESQIGIHDAELKAVEKRLEAFGTLNKLTGFFQKPAIDDFEILYKETHYKPFWRIATKAHYVYDRNTHYQIDNVKDEVKSATIEGKDFLVTNSHIHIPAIEHCQNDVHQEKLIDGLSGTNSPNLKQYIEKGATEAKSEQITLDFDKDSIIIPPQFRISGIMREMLANMIKGIQADKIFEEEIELSSADLYYRPVYSFKFFWKSKKKEGIIEIDAINGDVSAATRTFNEYLGKALNRDFLFDLGADAAGLIIPGGSIAVKMAKKALDMNENDTSK